MTKLTSIEPLVVASPELQRAIIRQIWGNTIATGRPREVQAEPHEDRGRQDDGPGPPKEHRAAMPEPHPDHAERRTAVRSRS